MAAAILAVGTETLTVRISVVGGYARATIVLGVVPIQANITRCVAPLISAIACASGKLSPVNFCRMVAAVDCGSAGTRAIWVSAIIYYTAPTICRSVEELGATITQLPLPSIPTITRATFVDRTTDGCGVRTIVDGTYFITHRVAFVTFRTTSTVRGHVISR